MFQEHINGGRARLSHSACASKEIMQTQEKTYFVAFYIASVKANELDSAS
jgi:hypothetical protein